MTWRFRAMALLVATTLVAGGCFYDFDRELGLAPGDVAGRALRETGSAAPYARIQVDGTGRVYRSKADGGFAVHGLVPGGWTLGVVDDENGDGWPERAARRTFTMTRAAHAEGLFGASDAKTSFVVLGDVLLDGIVKASGRVLRSDGTPAVGARVFALRSVTLPSAAAEGELLVELSADAETASDVDGAFSFLALPAGALSFVAFTEDAGQRLASVPVAREAAPRDEVDVELLLSAAPALRRVAVELWPPPYEEDLVRVHVVAPGAVPAALGVAPLELGDDDVSAGVPRLELEVPLGAWDVWIETKSGLFGVLRQQIASLAGSDVLVWGRLLLSPDDACAGVKDGDDIRDCDHDALQGLPPLSDLGDPLLTVWRECAPACALAFGEAALGASCSVAGAVYDCDDDGDGQSDVTETIACYGLGRGSDPDGDGLCGGDDPYPQCRENDPAHERCKAGAVLVDFPPGVRAELEDAEVDAGPNDAGLVDAGLVDAGRLEAGDDDDAGPSADGGEEDAGDLDSGPAPPVSCETQEACLEEEACHPDLGLCVPDCGFSGSCGSGEVCTPGAEGYVCRTDCRLDEATCGLQLCGSDGLCSPGTAPVNGVYGDTWRWDGAARSWSYLTTTTDPGARRGHVMAPNGEGVVLLGGEDGQGVTHYADTPLVLSAGDWLPRTSLFYYDTVTFGAAAGVSTIGSGSFYTLAIEYLAPPFFAKLPCCQASLEYVDTAMPTPSRTRAAMADDGEGHVWLFGGQDGFGAPLSDLWLFDIADEAAGWSSVNVAAGGPVPRYDHAFTFAGTAGEMLLTGGRQQDGGLLKDSWRLTHDAVLGTASWTLLPDAGLGPRAGHGMSWDGSRVIVYGGSVSRAAPATRDVLVLDELNEQWTAARVTSVPPPARSSVRMAHDGAGNLILYGGEQPAPVTVHRDVFAGATGTVGDIDWREHVSSGALPAEGAAFAMAPNGDLWVFGGRDHLGALTNQLFVYGPGGSVTELTQASGGPTPREGASMAFHPTAGKLFLFAGRDENGYQNDLYAWEAVSGNFLAVAPTGDVPPFRAYGAMAPSVPDGSILLYGGRDEVGALDDMWMISQTGSFFHPIIGVTQPSARAEAAVTYTNEGVYLFGGFGSGSQAISTLGDLWMWSGEETGRWSRVLPEGTPALGGATLTFEPGSSPQRLWLFGGSDESAASPEAYYLDADGTSWLSPSLLGAERPLARSRHAAGFVDGELLIVGGFDEARDLSTFQSPP